jgi:hypothetical protein
MLLCHSIHFIPHDTLYILILFYLLYISDISPILFVFQITQNDHRLSLTMTDYCRNMQEPTHTTNEWYKSVNIVGFF